MSNSLEQTLESVWKLRRRIGKLSTVWILYKIKNTNMIFKQKKILLNKERFIYIIYGPDLKLLIIWMLLFPLPIWSTPMLWDRNRRLVSVLLYKPPFVDKTISLFFSLSPKHTIYCTINISLTTLFTFLQIFLVLLLLDFQMMFRWSA